MSSGAWQGLGGRGQADDTAGDDEPASEPDFHAGGAGRMEPYRIIEEASAAGERIRQDAERDAAQIVAAARSTLDQEAARIRR